jgi:hypothetical protein
MNFDYSPIVENMFFEDLEKLSLEEQNEKLKIELKSNIQEKRELLNEITFLQSQISKYQNLI